MEKGRKTLRSSNSFAALSVTIRQKRQQTKRRRVACFMVLSLYLINFCGYSGVFRVSPLLNSAKFHAKGGGGLGPCGCKDLTPPAPKAFCSTKHKKDAFYGILLINWDFLVLFLVIPSHQTGSWAFFSFLGEALSPNHRLFSFEQTAPILIDKSNVML